MAKIDRNTDRREVRLEDADERRHEMRSAAYTVASAARRVAVELDAEAERPDYRQPAGWHGSRLAVSASWYLAGRYTAAALDVLDEAHRLVASAVAADRAAGADWSTIGDTLGVSADTASRRYRTAAPADDRRAR
ncbi:hypothetical protein [Streptomyces sp. A30]|uniref:hypothetical protein n=1 Tax=Streptomyces sp. A30 TaxID=2789273 RepID=UPI0039817CA1